MTNTNSPRSFQILNDRKYYTRKVKVAASYAGKSGDPVFLEASGRATATVGDIYGLQDGGIEDVSVPGDVVLTADVDDLIIMYYEPNVKFSGQISVGALADTFTTRSSAAAFDLGGSAGARFVDAASSSDDLFKVISDYHEDNGEPSEVGAFQKKVFTWNLDKHFLGTIA